MKCKKCGFEIPDICSYCLFCGTIVECHESEFSSNRKYKKYRWWRALREINLKLILIILGCVLAIFLYLGKLYSDIERSIRIRIYSDISDRLAPIINRVEDVHGVYNGVDYCYFHGSSVEKYLMDVDDELLQIYSDLCDLEDYLK